MNTIKVMLPVLVMILIGIVFRKTRFISEPGMEDIKNTSPGSPCR